MMPIVPVSLCVCPFAPKVETTTRVELIIHTREWRRSSNTGRFVHLALANSRIRLHGVRDAEPGAAASGLDPDDPGTLILFPGRRARPLTPELRAGISGPVTLVVPDGNWTQTSHMMSRLPALARARVIELPGPTEGQIRMRRNVFADRMSTYEAVAQAMGLLEGQDVEEQMIDFYRRAVDRMLMLRGKIKAAEIYGGMAQGTPPDHHSTR